MAWGWDEPQWKQELHDQFQREEAVDEAVQTLESLSLLERKFRERIWS